MLVPKVISILVWERWIFSFRQMTHSQFFYFQLSILLAREKQIQFLTGNRLNFSHQNSELIFLAHSLDSYTHSFQNIAWHQPVEYRRNKYRQG